jgi:hypothetical protein
LDTLKFDQAASSASPASTSIFLIAGGLGWRFGLSGKLDILISRESLGFRYPALQEVDLLDIRLKSSDTEGRDTLDRIY